MATNKTNQKRTKAAESKASKVKSVEDKTKAVETKSKAMEDKSKTKTKAALEACSAKASTGKKDCGCGKTKTTRK